jgi:hypothetical protein
MTPPLVTFDRLTYVDRLKAAGLEEEQARALAEALDGALRDAIVTRADLGELERRLERKIETAAVDLLSDLSRRLLLAVLLIGALVYVITKVIR